MILINKNCLPWLSSPDLWRSVNRHDLKESEAVYPYGGWRCQRTEPNQAPALAANGFGFYGEAWCMGTEMDGMDTDEA